MNPVIDDVHEQTRDRLQAQLVQVCQRSGFSAKYYAYCAAYSHRGPEMPLDLQQAVLDATDRAFRFHDGERFFSWRDNSSVPGKLGLNLKIDMSSVELIFVSSINGHNVGGTFAGLALDCQRITNPGYAHVPPYPCPHFASRVDFLTVLTEGFVLYDELAAAIRAETWA